MAAFDEQDYTKSFDLKIWKRLGPVLSNYKLAFFGMIFCNGICAVYRNMVCQRYTIDASAAADALYEMMPESLKHYWWK